MNNQNSQHAFAECKALLPDHFLDTEEASKKYGTNTLSINRSILCAVSPSCYEDIISILQIANKYLVPVYPISTGHNWGYGSATPIVEKCIILDLCLMNKIIAFDPILGLVTVQPGVTQGQLALFLLEKNAPFMTPVTGAGPSCSLLGNILERGYGLNPHVDHFGALMSLKAILPNGKIYQSAMCEQGATRIDGAYKWGIGPYLDGLFTQSNMGIVVEMTIALAPQAEYMEAIVFSLDSDQRLVDIINQLQIVLKTVGMNLGVVKLTNQHRLIAIQDLLPDLIKTKPLTSVDPEIDRQLRKNNIQPWLGTSAIYGNKKMVAATRDTIKKLLSSYVKELHFMSDAKLNFQMNILTWLPIGKKKLYFSRLSKKLMKLILMMKGQPDNFALDIAYFKSGSKPSDISLINPDRDGCGIIWYSPLIPMTSQDVESFLFNTKQLMLHYKIDPVITFSSLSERCFDCIVPILFDKNDPMATQNAHECYRALFSLGKRYGYLPYRMPAPFINLVVNEDDVYWKLAKSIKSIIDPNNIIAPGRYSLK